MAVKSERNVAYKMRGRSQAVVPRKATENSPSYGFRQSPWPEAKPHNEEQMGVLREPNQVVPTLEGLMVSMVERDRQTITSLHVIGWLCKIQAHQSPLGRMGSVQGICMAIPGHMEEVALQLGLGGYQIRHMIEQGPRVVRGPKAKA